MNYLLQELNISTNYERICLQCGRQEIDPWVREDPLEKHMATHSSILAWRIPQTEEPMGYNPGARKESDTNE